MAEASYERQHLAMQAAGYINADGSTVTTFGCQLTYLATGHYALILDASDGVVADESFMKVQAKGAVAVGPVVEEVSDTQKNIRVFNAAGAATDAAIEIGLWKSVTRR